MGVWAGFVGVPWWFALIGGVLFAIYIVASAVAETQHEFELSRDAVQVDVTWRLAPLFAVSLSVEWGAVFLVGLFLGRGIGSLI
jgi:hypothetical protein